MIQNGQIYAVMMVVKQARLEALGQDLHPSLPGQIVILYFLILYHKPLDFGRRQYKLWA